MPTETVYAASRQMTRDLLAFIEAAGDAALVALERGAGGLSNEEATARAVQAIFDVPHGERLETLLRELKDSVVMVAARMAVSQYRGAVASPDQDPAPLRNGMAAEFRANGFRAPDSTSAHGRFADAIAGPLAEFYGLAKVIILRKLAPMGKVRLLTAATHAAQALQEPEHRQQLKLLLVELEAALINAATTEAVHEHLHRPGAGR